MKKYNEFELGEIIPQEQRISEKGQGPSHEPLKGGPFIVVTISELKQLWDEVELRGYNEGKWSGSLDVNGFDKYLESKGIKI